MLWRVSLDKEEIKFCTAASDKVPSIFCMRLQSVENDACPIADNSTERLQGQDQADISIL